MIKPIRVGKFWNNNYIEYKSNGDKNKNLSVREYLNEIEPYLRNTIIHLQKSGTWKVQLTIAITFISSTDADEEQVMHWKSDDIEFLTYDNANDIIDESFELLFSRHQIGLETSMRGSDFIFDLVQPLYYHLFKRGGSSIDFPDWIKKKKAIIIPKNIDDKCFQYAATVALNNGEIESHPERISNIIPFINKHS